MDCLNTILILAIATAIPNIARAQFDPTTAPLPSQNDSGAAKTKGEADAILNKTVALAGFHSHYSYLIALTKNGWSVTNSAVYTIIAPRVDGGIFSSFPNASYVLKNDSSNESMFCLVVGEAAGGFNTNVSYSMECLK
jgi:hypothetical protein